jgi:hypothetical protein
MIAKEFMIFDCSELVNIDFTEVMETSIETVRKSIDGTKTFVKWDSIEIPKSVENLKTKSGPYTYDEILEILQSPEWTKDAVKPGETGVIKVLYDTKKVGYINKSITVLTNATNYPDGVIPLRIKGEVIRKN